MKSKCPIIQKEKKVSKTIFYLLFTALLVTTINSCDKSDNDLKNTTADIGYEGFKSDAQLLHEFAYRKESLILNALNYTSDGFTKAPFEGSVNRDKFDLFFLELEEMNKNAKQYEQAIKRLEESGVLLRPTRTRGLATSTKDFFVWLSGSGKRNRERITTVASNMNSSDRTKLYNGLRKDWKDKASSEGDFWNKLGKGDYDSSSGQMYNDFYHNADTDFPFMAQDKDLTPQKIVVNEGAKGIEVGANLALDAASAVVPGFGTGMTIIKVSDNVEKMANSKTWKEAAEHGFNAAGDILEEATGGIGYTGFNGSDVVNAVRIKLHSSIFKKDDKNETKGKITIKDLNKDKSISIAIIQKKLGEESNDGSPSIYVTLKEMLSGGSDMLVEAGNWLVTVVNEQGMRETVVVKVENGKVAIVEVNTEEPEGEDNSDEKINPKLLTYVRKCFVSMLIADDFQDYTYGIGTGVDYFGIYFSVNPKGTYMNNVFTTSYTKTFNHSESLYGTVMLSGNISLTIDETKQVVKTGKIQLIQQNQDSYSSSNHVCNMSLQDMPFKVEKDKIVIKYSGDDWKEKIKSLSLRTTFSGPYGSGVTDDIIKEVFLTIELVEKPEQ